VRLVDGGWFFLATSFTFFACGGPKEVAKVRASARLLGAIDGRVYWGEEASLHWMEPGVENPISFDLPGGDWATRSNFAADRGGFHFSHHNRLSSFRSTGGSQARDVDLLSSTTSAGGHPSGAVTDGECVYVADGDVDCHGHGAILGLPRSQGKGRGCERREAPVNGLQPLEFRLDAQYFYWIQGWCSERFSAPGGDIVALPRKEGPAIVIASGEAGMQPQDLWVGETGVYWKAVKGIRYAAKAPFRPPVTLVEGDVNSLFVAGGSVFFTKRDGVYWLDQGRREPKRIAAESDARHLVADDRFLYWLRSDPGQVIRLRRPD
jgi:hypothetical protein